MLVIRFLRVGKKNQPSFQIVVTQKERGPRSGRFIEKLGFYNPLTKDRKVNAERVKYWLSVGAKPSDTVWNLLVAEKVVEGKKVAVHAKGRVSETEETKEAEETKETKSAGGIKEAEEAKAPKSAEPKEESKEEKPAEEKSAEAPEQKTEEAGAEATPEVEKTEKSESA